MTIGSDNVHVDLQTFAEIFVFSSSPSRRALGSCTRPWRPQGVLRGVGASARRRLRLKLRTAPENFAALQTTCQADRHWRVYQEAVGATDRIGRLREAESWTHTLAEDGQIEVRVTGIDEVVRRARNTHPARIVAKIDVEGAEVEICCEGPAEALAGIDALVVELHPHTLSHETELRERLARVGFREMARQRDHIFFD